MDIFLIILGSICLLAGLAGCILPMLPGPPLAYFSLVLLHFTDKTSFSTTQLLFWLLLVIAIQILDYFIPSMGVKKMGGTRAGNYGCIVGTLVGLFFFPPWGILIGSFIGAVVGELISGQVIASALRAGFGAFLGFLVGTILKLTLCGWFVFCFIKALF